MATLSRYVDVTTPIFLHSDRIFTLDSVYIHRTEKHEQKRLLGWCTTTSYNDPSTTVEGKTTELLHTRKRIVERERQSNEGARGKACGDLAPSRYSLEIVTSTPNLLRIYCKLSVRYTDKRIERGPRSKVVEAAAVWKRSRRSVERRFAIVTSQTRLPEQLWIPSGAVCRRAASRRSVGVFQYRYH